MFALLISLKFVEPINFHPRLNEIIEISGVLSDTNWSNLRGGTGLSWQECHFDIGSTNKYISMQSAEAFDLEIIF